MPVVGQGGQITLEAQYVDGAGNPVVPTTPLIDIVDAGSVVRLNDGVPTSVGTGAYHYTYTVPVDAVLGNWTAAWTGVVNGVGVTGGEQFTVVAAGSVSVGEDAASVWARVKRESGLSASVYRLTSEEFETLGLAIVADVIEEHWDRVGDGYTLDDPELFLAAVYETIARMLQRISLQYGLEGQASKTVTMGPLSVSRQWSYQVYKNLGDGMQYWHARAEAKLSVAGVNNVGAHMRVWVPATQITVI